MILYKEKRKDQKRFLVNSIYSGSLLLKVDSFFLLHLLVRRFASFERSPIIEMLINNQGDPYGF